MKNPAYLLICSGILLCAGCAPLHLFGSKKETSDVSANATPAPNPQISASGTASAGANPSSTPRRSPTPSSRRSTTTGSKSSSPSASAKPQAEFPVAKPVPGKPGYVYDPFNANGGYIDVTGYAPGSKVKDPVTKKIFIVP